MHFFRSFDGFTVSRPYKAWNALALCEGFKLFNVFDHYHLFLFAMIKVFVSLLIVKMNISMVVPTSDALLWQCQGTLSAPRYPQVNPWNSAKRLDFFHLELLLKS